MWLIKLVSAYVIVVGSGVSFGVEANAQTDFPSPEQFQTAFNQILSNQDPINGLPPWSLGSHFENLLLASRTPGRNQDDYRALIIEQGNELTRLTSTKTGVPDIFTNLTGEVLLSGFYTCGKPAAFLVHHGYVWAPIMAAVVDYMEIIGTNTPRQTRTKINSIFRVSMLGLNYFSRDKAAFNDKFAYVLPSFPAQSPSCTDIESDNIYAGNVVPANYAAAAGSLAIEILKMVQLPDETLNSLSPNFVTNKAIYTRRQTTNLNMAFESILPYARLNNLGHYIWKYMPNGRPEDTSHGALVIDFLVKAKQENYDKVTTNIIQNAVKTFFATYNGAPNLSYSHIETYFNRGKDVRLLGNATYVTGLSRWISLAKSDCSVYQTVKDIQNYRINGIYPYKTGKTGYLLTHYQSYCP